MELEYANFWWLLGFCTSGMGKGWKIKGDGPVEGLKAVFKETIMGLYPGLFGCWRYSRICDWFTLVCLDRTKSGKFVCHLYVGVVRAKQINGI